MPSVEHAQMKWVCREFQPPKVAGGLKSNPGPSWTHWTLHGKMYHTRIAGVQPQEEVDHSAK